MTTRAFSLIELLSVIAILAITLVLTVPPATQILRASNIGNGGDQVVTALAQARQSAMARNRTVEVRFYKYAETGDPEEGRFHGLQTFVVEPSAQGASTNALGRKVTLPPATYLSATPALSSLLDPVAAPVKTGAALNVSVPPCGLAYTAATFQFYPDGSTSLPAGTPLFLTLVPSDTPDTATTPPLNFATIVLQQASGKTQLHRP